jgi:hypothetical protein
MRAAIVGGALAAFVMGLASGLATARQVKGNGLLCPPQCEVRVEPAGGERLRATCWCDR